jgi:hypothetical protein
MSKRAADCELPQERTLRKARLAVVQQGDQFQEAARAAALPHGASDGEPIQLSSQPLILQSESPTVDPLALWPATAALGLAVLRVLDDDFRRARFRLIRVLNELHSNRVMERDTTSEEDRKWLCVQFRLRCVEELGVWKRLWDHGSGCDDEDDDYVSVGHLSPFLFRYTVPRM